MASTVTIDEAYDWPALNEFQRRRLDQWTDEVSQRVASHGPPMVLSMMGEAGGPLSEDAHRYDASRAEAEQEMAEWDAILRAAGRRT